MFKNIPKKIKIIIIVLIGLFLLSAGVGGYFYYQQKKGKDSRPWYAIYLDSSQIYYGHISGRNNTYIKLTKIYYLQQASPDSKETEEKTESGEKKPNLSLMKFAAGNEVHGPKDEMYINRDHVLKFEPLKEDSEVVKLIREYEKKK